MVTSINLIIAVGLAVDYSAHIALAFMTVKGSRNGKQLTHCPLMAHKHTGSFCQLNIDGLVQERRNSSALAMELRLSSTNSPNGIH